MGCVHVHHIWEEAEVINSSTTGTRRRLDTPTRVLFVNHVVYNVGCRGKSDFGMDKINRQLVDAVFVDDIERATHLLEEGASVNARGWVVYWLTMCGDIAIELFALKIELLDCSDESVLE